MEGPLVVWIPLFLVSLLELTLLFDSSNCDGNFSETVYNCSYYNISQSCCSGGSFIFNTQNGPPVCYDGNDLCGSDSLVGNGSILRYNVEYDKNSETCTCDYDLEICPITEETSCIGQTAGNCCPLTGITISCDDIDSSDCQDTLEYECTNKQESVCSTIQAKNLTDNLNGNWEYYYKYQESIYWWYDGNDQTVNGQCYCIYDYLSDNCDSPTSSPTIQVTENTQVVSSYFAEFNGQFTIEIKESSKIDCNYTWETYVFGQILESASNMDVKKIECDLNDNSYTFVLNFTSQWESKSEYRADTSALDRLESDPLNEMSEYGPEDMISAELTHESFSCPKCYLLSHAKSSIETHLLTKIIMTIIAASIFVFNIMI